MEFLRKAIFTITILVSLMVKFHDSEVSLKARQTEKLGNFICRHIWNQLLIKKSFPVARKYGPNTSLQNLFFMKQFVYLLPLAVCPANITCVKLPRLRCYNFCLFKKLLKLNTVCINSRIGKIKWGIVMRHKRIILF